MMKLLLSTSALALFSLVAVATEPQKVWETSGFKQPESAFYDRTAGAIYISNINGDLMTKDGNGFIAKLASDGKVLAMEWVKGLDGPAGLAVANSKLYAADVDRIVEIDTTTGEITRRYEAPGARFLNDLAADKSGRVYASDMVTNSIWVLDNSKLSLFVQDDALENRTGFSSRVVGSWSVRGATWPRTSRPRCPAT
jgi:hypothetical protein